MCVQAREEEKLKIQQNQYKTSACKQQNIDFPILTAHFSKNALPANSQLGIMAFKGERWSRWRSAGVGGGGVGWAGGKGKSGKGVYGIYGMGGMEVWRGVCRE